MSLSVFWGNYYGHGDTNPKDFLGGSFDAQFKGTGGAFVWSSASLSGISFAGSGKSIFSVGGGASVGVGLTFKLFGFDK